MINHRLRESNKSFGSQVDPEKAEELKRTKTDIENNLTRILELTKKVGQSKNDGSPKHSRNETELVGLIEDLYKQYQSLYALYDLLTVEYGRVVPRKKKKESSVSASSSESDSEYFSSDEVDGNNRRSENEHHNASVKARESERSTFVNTDEVFKTSASAKAKEYEEQLTSQMKEVEESLSQQKGNLKLQVENQAHEVKRLSAENAGLKARTLELELLLKEKNGVVSILQEKLKNNENQAKSSVEQLMAQIDELEEKLKCDKNEALSQRKDLNDQLNAMQQNFESLCNQKNELEAQMERKNEEISQFMIQIENLKENLAETSLVEQSMLEEKEHSLAKITDLELELESRCNGQNELEEQLRDRSCEINRVVDENKALQDRNHELKKALTQRGEEISAFLKEHESDENGASMKAMALTAEVNDLRLKLDALHEEISNMQKEYAESLAKVENLNVKLTSQMADREKTIKEQATTIEQISAECKQEQILSKRFKLNRQFAERKMEELAQEFRKKLEDNIRLLHQRIHVAEQLNNENKASCKLTRQMYEEQNKMMAEKIASYEDELKRLQVVDAPISNGLDLGALNELKLGAVNGSELVAKKLEEHTEYVLNRVTKMAGEVQFAKVWVKKRNDEMKQLKDNVDCLKVSLVDKEEKELTLREKVWKLEANVSKEGGEKLNLMKAVNQLEKKVGKLEKSLKEKEDDLVSLGEQKREAIRQLCFLIDFHRGRCDHLKDLITKMRVDKRTRA